MDNRYISIAQELHEMQAGRRPSPSRVANSAQGAEMTVDGRRVINLCSNNYLGLANDEELKAAAIRAIETFGAGTGAVRPIAGTNVLHLAFEEEIADFKQAPAAVSFTSGFTANLAVLGALAGPEDIIFSDELNHASIIDGARLSRAKIVRYRHADPASLRDVIGSAFEARRKFIVTDGVFSMDGDIAPLRELADIAAANDAFLIVDDAHGEGVLGRGGRGAVDHFDLHGRVDVEVGTMSKAFGVLGGFACGSKDIISLIRSKGRPFIFSNSLSPADAGANICAVQRLRAHPEFVERLWTNTRYFRRRLQDSGFKTLGETPVVPVIIGDTDMAMRVAERLFAESVFAVPVTYPIVPRGTERIRLMVSALHDQEMLDRAVNALVKAMNAERAYAPSGWAPERKVVS